MKRLPSWCRFRLARVIFLFLMAFFGMDRRIGVIALDPPSLFSIRGRINGWKCRWTGMGPFHGPQLGRLALWLVGKTDGESINWSTAPRGPLGIELSAGWRYTTK